MKSKSPFAMKSPLNAYKYADTGEYAANASAKVIKPIVSAEIGMGIIKGAQNFKESYDSAKEGKADAKEKGRKNQWQEDLTKSQIKLNESKAENLNPTSALKDDTSFVSTRKFGVDTSVEGMVESGMPERNQILGAPENYKNPLTQMKGSPNKLIGDTMDPSGQINPGQPSDRAIDMAAIGNPYATPGADFDPQSKMKAESIFGSAGQRQGLMNLGTPLHTKGHEGDFIKDHKHSTESKNPATPKWKNGDPLKKADKSISSTDEPRRLEEGEIGAPTEREDSDRNYLEQVDADYNASLPKFPFTN
jgi:hypothetical protein